MKKLIFIILLFIVFSLLPSYSADEEILFIFDSSQSMAENFYGKAKFEIAVREIRNMAEKLGNSKKIGLRKIGITIDSSIFNYLQNPDEMCKATQLTVPIRTNSVGYIKSSLEDVFPLGTTPLEYTLKLSLNSDFTQSPQVIKHIILVTDGADSCNGDPCRYARAAMMQRKDVIIDIIAIGVNDVEVQQLKCIADAANGKLFLASDPPKLQQAFDTIYNNITASPTSSQSSVFTEINNNKPKGTIKYKSYHFETYD